MRALRRFAALHLLLENASDFLLLGCFLCLFRSLGLLGMQRLGVEGSWGLGHGGLTVCRAVTMERVFVLLGFAQRCDGKSRFRQLLVRVRIIVFVNVLFVVGGLVSLLVLG